MTIDKRLCLVSYLAPNWWQFYQAIATYLGRVVQMEIQLQPGECDPLEDPLLLQDQLDLAFICGLPLIRYSQTVTTQLQTLVAPVMESSRYGNHPVYFADVIVNAQSKIAKFADLSGKTFCYNDLGSNSGYNLLCHHLIQQRYPENFFSNTLQSGSHQRSIRWVVEGLADCAAIDSVVLEQEFKDFPELLRHLRVVEVLGPAPMPPLVVAQRLGISLIEQMRLALLQPDADLQRVMERFGVRRFAAVELKDYQILNQIYSDRLHVTL
ncbi:ABC-type phosphate/phosphonate transport system periplasmic component-like protein [Trichormus variabilis ATCC 29413]|uniref:ABC-type phosphate/phosphonate transport system periplasmic component-like protein n=2 Tax=Anabaena variabilis TaxID=264691 RepID=Q3M325_TRIV2|nr:MULTISPECIES: PhnD/SsuA/transferrin family substrate-binding protein [Nostocaceae]ABA24611.1 ABC-type phosphate/phosphonate transport system periplasmic component-like protein [Trichormus variabilis ATCC 29413]MBC1213458.1 PhnD/SsuA/transferrin family substrate-binding protein [Trichormus variabilis ARAD]MBC1256738.1 PhnD/SsuA/transferrin family substrate-binding protein [Trichormus variabilis V5]MBC1266479.1 PhnD/SsuA/transferrin family substrate-binding protein [Trichormus variabilis FSR]